MGIKQFHLRVLGETILASISWPSVGALPTFVPVEPPTEALSFIGTGLRLPTASLTRSGNNYVAGDMAMGMPDYDVDEIWFFFPTFFCNTTAEVDCPNGYTIEGIGTRASGGARTPGLIDGGSDAIVIDPSETVTQNGKWIRFTPAAPIPAGTTQVFSFAQFIPDGTYPRSRGGTVATSSIFGGTTKDERSQGSTSSLLSTLSGSSNYSGSNGNPVWPAAAMARKPAGVPSALILGTSIDYGAHQTGNIAFFTDRHAWGYMEMGLDDNQSSERIQALNWAIPSWGHESTGTTKSQADVTACARQLWAMERAREINGGRPLVDMIWSGHGTNTSGNQTQLRADYRLLFSVWRDAVGTAETPCYQAEMLPYPSSTDGFATLVNQTVPANFTYPTGVRWQINADIGGADGLGDAAANLRADDTIQGSFAPWRISAADLDDDRDKLSVRAFNTTLAADYSGSGSLSLTAAPPVGDYLSLVGGGNTAGFIVTSVTGSGPFSVTGVFFNGNGTAFTTGAALRSIWHDIGGLHPGPFAHRAYALQDDEGSVVNFKIALGFTTPPVAPEITASSISGTAEDGQILTANATATGSPTPTFTYQWQKGGTNISGQTAQTITLNAGTMGLSNGDVISCEITATNASGSDTAEPTITFSSGAVSLIDTGDFTGVNTDANNSNIISANSFEMARQPSGGITAIPEFDFSGLTVGVAYRFRFTVSAFEAGADPNITLIDIQLRDGTTQITRPSSATSVDVTYTIANGALDFRAPTTGRGARVTSLLITAA